MTFIDAVTAGKVQLDGDPSVLITIFGNLDTFETGFAIVEP
jgi:alkyl sulfatase BDS1-like metallo-beta-lactamase superfamily hydrolase